MSHPDDKRAFAERLKQALKRSPKRIHSATGLAIAFNLSYRGDPVTPQAVQKWLTGQTRPTPDKIQTLAEMLKVSNQWLRFGIPEPPPRAPRQDGLRADTGATPAPAVPTPVEWLMLQRLRLLPEHQRDLIGELVEQFAIQQEMWQR